MEKEEVQRDANGGLGTCCPSCGWVSQIVFGRSHAPNCPALGAEKEIPRRVRIDRMTPAELAITKAMYAVEDMEGDVRLTDALNLLTQARERVADVVDDVQAPEVIPSSASITYSEGKKIYDQGWNDGIDHLKKLLMLAVEQRFRNP